MSTASYHHGNLQTVLLTSAEKELKSNGIEAFSLRGVAKRAGVSHAAPAHHFGNVTGLLTALAANGFDRLIAVPEHHQPKDDRREELKTAAAEYVDFVAENPDLTGLMFASKRVNLDDDDLSVAMEAFFKRLLALVRRLPEASGQSEYEVMVAVTAAWSMIHGFSNIINSRRLPVPLKGLKTDRDWLIGVFIDQLIGGQG